MPICTIEVNETGAKFYLRVLDALQGVEMG